MMLGDTYRIELKRVRKQRYRARRAGLTADLMAHHWLYLLLVWGQRCAYCGAPADTMDHIIPVANGGGTTKTNIIPCCLACNEAKGTAVWLPAWAGSGAAVKW